MSTDKIEKPAPKKRGRKPKGGKIVTTNVSNIVKNEIITNIVLHLKCKKSDIQSDLYISDLNYNPTIENIEAYSINNTKGQDLDLNLNLLSDNDNKQTNEEIVNGDIEKKHSKDIKFIWKKLKTLETDLHTNNLDLKKSACFWCTYDFDTPCIYIPKCKFKESYKVYGCFCSPECACAYLVCVINRYCADVCSKNTRRSCRRKYRGDPSDDCRSGKSRGTSPLYGAFWCSNWHWFRCWASPWRIV